MKTSLVNSLYLCVIPPWLTQYFDSHRLTLKDLQCFDILSSILSEKDVCFYYCYLKRAQINTKGMYTELRCISKEVNNTNWITNHQEMITECESIISMSESAIDPDVIPPAWDMSSAHYEPRGYSNTTLFLLGRTKPLYVTYADYCSSVMNQLSLLVGYDQAVHSRLLESYVTACQKPV